MQDVYNFYIAGEGLACLARVGGVIILTTPVPLKYNIK